jgi:hypothetical protein
VRRNVYALRALARKQRKPTREQIARLASAAKKVVEGLKDKK